MIGQIRAIWEWREVLKYLIVSELRVLYRNRALGYLWSLLDPLMMMGVYVLLVAVVFDRGGPQFPVLLFSALLSWWWFIFSLNGAVTSISSKAKLIQSIYFPKIILPIERTITGLIRYLLGLVVLLPLLFVFDANWSVNALWLPVLILVQFLVTAGCCLIVAALGVYFVDLRNILTFSLRAWLFLSPALYSVADVVPDRFRPIYMLNPFAALFESYKNILVLGLPPSEYLLVAAGVGVVVTLGGLAVFAWKEPDFAKAV